jgi:hypothetical protein
MSQAPSDAADGQFCGSGFQGNNMTKSPPITRQHARSVGEFVVSLSLAPLPHNLRKSLI